MFSFYDDSHSRDRKVWGGDGTCVSVRDRNRNKTKDPDPERLFRGIQ